MRQHSIIRHTLMALCAYLAVGITMAQSNAPAVSVIEGQPGAVRELTDCQAVFAVAHGITRYLGAEDVARQLIELSKPVREVWRVVVGE